MKPTFKLWWRTRHSCRQFQSVRLKVSRQCFLSELASGVSVVQIVSRYFSLGPNHRASGAAETP